MKKGREEKTKFSKILPNNQIITACHIKLQVQEMTMKEKLTMMGLNCHSKNRRKECQFILHFLDSLEHGQISIGKYFSLTLSQFFNYLD